MQYTDAMANRLRRIEGQIRGVLSMMDDKRDCRDVVTQLSAIRSAVDKVLASVVVENLESCIRQDLENNSDTRESVKEAMDLLLKAR